MNLELDTQKLNIFVAYTRNQRVYANEYGIPWKNKLKKDLQFVKKITSRENVAVLMGRLTFEDVGRPFPNRINIIVSKTMDEREGIIVKRSFEDALQHCRDNNYIVVVFGGKSLYQEAMKHPFKLFVTLVEDLNFTGEKKFPEHDVKLTCIDDEVRQFLECPEHNGQKFIESGIEYSFYLGTN